MTAEDVFYRHFRHDFPSIVESLERQGGHEIVISENWDGQGRTVIFRRTRNGVGFGCAWQPGEGRLEGLGGRSFDRSRLESEANQDFAAEFEKRLSAPPPPPRAWSPDFNRFVAPPGAQATSDEPKRRRRRVYRRKATALAD